MTGFQCVLDSKPKFENDGIAGSLALAKTLAHLKKHVSILMDEESKEEMSVIFTDYFQDISHSLRHNVDI